MVGHARNSPSDAKRWIMCPGALNRCKALGLNKGGSSAPADEGTAAHWIRETCLELGLDAYDMLGTQVEVNGARYLCDMDMCEALQPGIDRIREFSGKPVVELRVNITPWVGKDEDGNDQFGTLDCGVCGEDLIVISDLKFGKGVPVQAVGNYQQVIYALGFWNQVARHITNAKKFLIIIDQPRNGQGGGEWEVSLDEMLAIGEYVKERAALTFDPNAPCTPSEEGCYWCPAKNRLGDCPEHDAWCGDMLGFDDSDLDEFKDFGVDLPVPDVTGLTPSRIKAIYENLPTLKSFIKRVEATVADAVKAGDGAVYDRKMVAGKRSRRKHREPLESELWLFENGFSDDRIINRELKTPAMLDKVVGRGKFPMDLVVGGEPTPVIAHIDDARPALPANHVIEEEIADLADFDD